MDNSKDKELDSYGVWVKRNVDNEESIDLTLDDDTFADLPDLDDSNIFEDNFDKENGCCSSFFATEVNCAIVPDRIQFEQLTEQSITPRLTAQSQSQERAVCLIIEA